MTGCIKVDFAGTRREAEQYAKEHGEGKIKVPRNAVHKGEFPMLSIKFTNHDEFRAGVEFFERLGWASEEQLVSRYDKQYVRRG